MSALTMMITDAGLDAIVDAQNAETDAIQITEIGLTAEPFIMAPTLVAVPGEFRRIDTIGGQSIAENVIHVTAYDPEAIAYDVTGFGLYSDDGTLIAVYSADADPVLSKAALATSLFALDIMLAADIAAVIEFGDALFSNPPATETTAGVAEIADDDEADAGVDDTRFMTPAKVRRIIDAALPSGVVMLWSGAIVAIPDGWLLCDGTNDTPDLRDKFVVGAGAAYAVDANGGALTHDHDGSTGGHALTITEMPSHDHPNGVGDQITTSMVYGTVAGSSVSNMNNDAAAGTVQGLTGPRGGGAAHTHGIGAANHLPPYFALAYIMKA